MILIYIMIIVVLMVGSILFFPTYAIITALVNNVTIPASMGGDWYLFLLAYRNWYLVLFIIFPLLLYIFVQTQKPKRVIL